MSAEDWTTTDGKTYQNVTVVQQEDDGVRITYDGGAGKIPYYLLPPDIQKRFGQDPDAVAAKKKAADQAADDAAKSAAAMQQQQQLEDQRKLLEAAAAAAKARDEARLKAQQASQLPVGLPVHVDQGPFPGFDYSYNKLQDICFLDTPAVNVFVDPAPVPPTGERDSLTFRIVTQGPRPETPDKIVAIFLSVGSTKKPGDFHEITFLADGKRMPFEQTDSKDANFSLGLGQVVQNLSFNLSPDDARAIIGAKTMQFNIGNDTYKLDPAGQAIFRKYLDLLAQLPPPSSAFYRQYLELMDKFPNLLLIISEVCEYIILGGFGLFILLVGGACVLGATRFFKM